MESLSETAEKELWTTKKIDGLTEEEKQQETQRIQQEVQKIQEHIAKELQPAVDRNLNLLFDAIDQVLAANTRVVNLLYPSPVLLIGKYIDDLKNRFDIYEQTVVSGRRALPKYIRSGQISMGGTTLPTTATSPAADAEDM